VPESYERRLPFIYAHAVLYALDAIGKILNVLAGMGLPLGITDARNAYKSALPYLVDVRDSAHHTEDRARWLDRNKRPLDLQPPSNIKLLVLSDLYGNRLAYTASDGYLREIEISTASVAVAQSAIQQVLDALSWRGEPHTAPD
jgi:hypothetical protein